MCIILAIPQYLKIAKEKAAVCFQRNPHGAGFAYLADNEVKIQKGFDTFDKFWEAFEPIQENNDGAKLVHFRVCSAGNIDAINTHPFSIDATHAMVHNGTLQAFKNVNSPVSDTILFLHNIIQPCFAEYPNFYKTKFGHFFIEETIGNGNKVAILRADGDCVIFNESAGERSEGIWFSNRSYIPLPPPKVKKKAVMYSNQKGTKREKPVGYRAVEDIIIEDANCDLLIEKGARVTGQQINELNHYYRKQWRSKCKLKHLIYKKIVEPEFLVLV